jgi:Flp pilus assembly protein CpaB
MRLNRFTRIGLACIGIALLLFFVSMWFRNLSAPTPTQTQVAETPNEVQTVSQNSSGMSAVALVDIPARSIITRDMLEMRPTAQNASEADTANYITDPGTQAVGFITSRRITPNQRVTRADLVGHITEVGVAGALQPGRRAMVVPILNKATLHDLVKVGDYVDIIGSYDGQESRSIVQNVRVLAVDVFVNDFPQVSGSQRGDHKAAPRGVATANPASPPGATPSSPPAPGQPAPAATATPAPASDAPPPRPEPALTLEVTPDQATAIALSQASNSVLDFILRPRPAVFSAVPEVRVAAMTKARLAPYADRQKRATTTPARPAASSNSAARIVSDFARSNRTNYPEMTPPVQPMPVQGGGQTAPAPAAPETYNIPIYGDGKMVRIDTVAKP